jgi:hypothetical protein
MKLPNGDAAIIEVVKIRDYCLSERHPLGRHKARVFRSALGLTTGDSGELMSALAEAARHQEAEKGVVDIFGARYIVDFSLTRGGKTADIRSCWIILNGETVPRFVTCFIL